MNKDSILDIRGGVFPGQCMVDLNLIIFSSTGHSCWMSSQVEDFASRALFSSCTPGWECLRNIMVAPGTKPQ